MVKRDKRKGDKITERERERESKNYGKADEEREMRMMKGSQRSQITCINTRTTSFVQF